MRLSRFLLLLIFITALSLLYVYQQTEVVHLAYAGQKKITSFEDLLDKNSVLRYNLGKRISLVRIGELSDNSDFQMPDTYKLVRLSSRERPKVSARAPKKENLASRIFGVRQEAEARTTKP